MAKGDKYLPLTRYLINSNRERVTLTFKYLEEITGGLPPSVYIYKLAWSDSSQHSFSFGWLRAGYSIDADFDNQVATFIRKQITTKPLQLEANYTKKNKSVKTIKSNVNNKSSKLSFLEEDNNSDNKLNINKILIHLSKSRPAFHSEADFQFALAWSIKEIYDQRVQIFIEYPYISEFKKMYIDIVVLLDNKYFIPIELKHKTKETTIVYNNTSIRLGNQGASDLGKFDYLVDIQRIEYLKDTFGFEEGYSIMLTNDPTYYKSNTRKTLSSEFDISNGLLKTGTLTWGQNSSIYKKNHRLESITLEDEYYLDWKIYSKTEVSFGEFYILISMISKL